MNNEKHALDKVSDNTLHVLSTDFDIFKAMSLTKKIIKVTGTNNALPYMKLIKLMYLCERKSIELHGRLITNDRFYSMRHGPVLSNVYDLLRENNADIYKKVNNRLYRDQKLWNENFITEGYNIIDKLTNNTHYLDADEVEIVEEVLSKYGSKGEWDLVKFVHENCPEWKDVGNTSMAISMDEIRQGIDLHAT